MIQNSTAMSDADEQINKTPEVYRRDTCRLCESTRLECVMPLKPTPVADAYLPLERKDESKNTYPLELFLCRDCGLVHLVDVVSPELLYRNYLYETTTSPGLVKHFQLYSKDVIDRVKPSKGNFVVEIGSNDGTLLDYFQKQGLRVLGVDPARAIAQRATEAGVETWPEFFTPELSEEIKKEKGAADIIIANNVMANIDQLDEFITGIQNLLAPGGVFIFETGYLVDSLENMVFDNVYHEHLCYLSVKPLKLFFKKHGLELIRVDRVPTKGGSIRGTVQLAGGSRTVESSVDDLIDLEEKKEVYQPKVYKEFSARINSEKNRLLKMLRSFKAEGKTVAGYGASHSVTTFLHYFELGDVLDLIVDDNPRKHNTFSPGQHIPVFSSEEIYKRKPDYIVILAWRFYEQIIKKHELYSEQKGRFIIPLPVMKVV